MQQRRSILGFWKIEDMIGRHYIEYDSDEDSD